MCHIPLKENLIGINGPIITKTEVNAWVPSKFTVISILNKYQENNWA